MEPSMREKTSTTGRVGSRSAEVVATNPGNRLEGPGGAKLGARQWNRSRDQMNETASSDNISTRLERIAEMARGAPGKAITTLAHHIDLAWLREAHRRTRKDGATGVDGQTAAEYAEELESNLQSLLDRAKSGRYRAPPVRRVYIPKDGTEMRPLGIPTFEDKVLQRAVSMLLEAVYEEDFLSCSYGFRPRRSAHQALDAIHSAAVRTAGGWVVELDIRKFFDSVSRAVLLATLRQRVRDGVVLRLVAKWLKAGVMENGTVTVPDAGTPQGGVISPLLANILLHEVLDTWFEREVRPRLRGRATLARYADDAVMVFERKVDALRVLEVLPKRFGKYGLTLHPEKTKLVEFQRPDRPSRRKRGRGTGPIRPETFDFLGFTIHWGVSLAGKWVVRERTSKSRFHRTLKGISSWCREHLHVAAPVQQRALNQKLRGHYGYFGRRGNFNRLWCIWNLTRQIWRRWLSRRSQKGKLDWRAMTALLERHPLAKPRSPLPRSESVA
jgi:RNA-directed DNA polymerase